MRARCAKARCAAATFSACRPGLLRRGLQRAAVGEGQLPGQRPMRVHGVEVRGRLFVALAAGEEGDARHGGRHAVLQHRDGPLGDFLDARPALALFLPGTTMFGFSTMPSSATRCS